MFSKYLAPSLNKTLNVKLTYYIKYHNKVTNKLKKASEVGFTSFFIVLKYFQSN